MIFRGLALLLFLTLLGGCGNPFGSGPSTVDPQYGVPVTTVTPLTPLGFEYVGGSKLSVSTTVGRRVDATVGTVTQPARLVTSRSRIVYLNVQGQISTH